VTHGDERAGRSLLQARNAGPSVDTIQLYASFHPGLTPHLPTALGAAAYARPDGRLTLVNRLEYPPSDEETVRKLAEIIIGFCEDWC